MDVSSTHTITSCNSIYNTNESNTMTDFTTIAASFSSSVTTNSTTSENAAPNTIAALTATTTTATTATIATIATTTPTATPTTTTLLSPPSRSPSRSPSFLSASTFKKSDLLLKKTILNSEIKKQKDSTRNCFATTISMKTASQEDEFLSKKPSTLRKAREKRKKVNEEMVHLQNRLFILQTEEQKAWKLIEETRQRAKEIEILKEMKERKLQQATRETEIQKKYKSQAFQKNLMERKKCLQKRQELSSHLKMEKCRWKKEMDQEKQQHHELACSKKTTIQMYEKMQLLKKAQLHNEQHFSNRSSTLKKIKEEEHKLQTKKIQIQKLEKKELEWIQKLRNIQHLQKNAYQELEAALVFISRPPIP